MMTIVLLIVWFTCIIGMAASLYVGQYISAGTMLMNLILCTIMLMERLDQ